jgi:two-component system, NarL family, response regulator LiaR
MSPAIRVLVVDDHEVVRKGIAAILETEPDVELVGEAANGVEAVSRCLELQPDIVLMDLVMPELDGIEAARQIKAQGGPSRILVLTTFATDDKVYPAIQAGAAGYLLKDSGADTLLLAIRSVHQGQASLHPEITAKLLRQLAREPEESASPERLTAREVDVLRLVAQGLSNQQIADHLTVSEATIRTHMTSILGKLQLTSRTQAALYALRRGIASLQGPESPP